MFTRILSFIVVVFFYNKIEKQQTSYETVSNAYAVLQQQLESFKMNNNNANNNNNDSQVFKNVWHIVQTVRRSIFKLVCCCSVVKNVKQQLLIAINLFERSNCALMFEQYMLIRIDIKRKHL